jgi:hypothetical protein
VCFFFSFFSFFVTINEKFSKSITNNRKEKRGEEKRREEKRNANE